MKLDLSFFLEPPEFEHNAILMVEALAPLSMVTAQPGSYFRSQPSPTNQMLYGLLENALGWHWGNNNKAETLDRRRLIDSLRKNIPADIRKSDTWKMSGWIKEKPPAKSNAFFSLLQYHLRFTLSYMPDVMHYDDLWTRYARRGDDFYGGSKNYDYRLEPLVNMLKQETAKFETKSKADIVETSGLFAHVDEETTVFQGALKPHFPEYYSSPTPREYICPKGAYQFRLQTTTKLASLLSEALVAPAAPLYLGTNDGWVDAIWEDLT